MSETDTVRSLLVEIRDNLNTANDRLADIGESLVYTTTGVGNLPAVGSIADLLRRALFSLDPLVPNLPVAGIAAMFANQFGSTYTTRWRDLLPHLAALESLASYFESFGIGEFGGPEQGAQDRLNQMASYLVSIYGQMQTQEYPSPMRNVLEDMREQLGSLNLGGAASQTYQIQQRDLLQQLLSCTPCDGGLPTEPSICWINDGPFIMSSGWTRKVVDATGDVIYIAALEGFGSVEGLNFSTKKVNAGLEWGLVDGFECWTSSGTPQVMSLCVSWEGNSGAWQAMACTPSIEADPYQDTVEVNSPAPGSYAPLKQAWPLETAIRSTFFVYAHSPTSNDAPPPTNARVFIVPRELQ